jgi:DNA-binding transcriptional MerR regulator
MRRSATARRLGVHADTLLALEERGLFMPTRDWNGHRRYSEEDVEALRRILYPRPELSRMPGLRR